MKITLTQIMAELCSDYIIYIYIMYIYVYVYALNWNESKDSKYDRIAVCVFLLALAKLGVLQLCPVSLPLSRRTNGSWRGSLVTSPVLSLLSWSGWTGIGTIWPKWSMRYIANDKKIQNRFKLHEITMMLVGATFSMCFGVAIPQALDLTRKSVFYLTRSNGI